MHRSTPKSTGNAPPKSYNPEFFYGCATDISRKSQFPSV